MRNVIKPAFHLLVLSFISSLLTGCLNTDELTSFKCSYGPVGERTSEAIKLYPVLTTNEGVELKPRGPSANPDVPFEGERTSKSLREYNIEVVGGTRKSNSGIINIGTSSPKEIFNELQVVISVKKKPSLRDTIEFVVDYQGKIDLNFDVQYSAENAKDVFVRAYLAHDPHYFDHFGCNVYEVRIQRGNKAPKTYFMSENSSSVHISCRGGAGAKGRDGAKGKDGAKGIDGSTGFKGKDGEPGGNGHHGEDGKPGGAGGKVELTMNAASVTFQDMITIDNRGGRGGNGGAGGAGGRGGEGGAGGARIVGDKVLGETKRNGDYGPAGSDGPAGRSGLRGADGGPLKIIVESDGK